MYFIIEINSLQCKPTTRHGNIKYILYGNRLCEVIITDSINMIINEEINLKLFTLRVIYFNAS